MVLLIIMANLLQLMQLNLLNSKLPNNIMELIHYSSLVMVVVLSSKMEKKSVQLEEKLALTNG